MFTASATKCTLVEKNSCDFATFPKLSQNFSKEISIDGKVEMSHWFVREVENSDENMEQWDSLMQRNPRFSLEIILYIIDGIKEI